MPPFDEMRRRQRAARYEAVMAMTAWLAFHLFIAFLFVERLVGYESGAEGKQVDDELLWAIMFAVR